MGGPDALLSPVDRAAESFRFYANTIYPGRSPLYVSLAMRIAEDTEILELASLALEKDALPNLFFAAVHLLLLKGEHHQLAAFYPSLNDVSRQYDYVYPYFRSFVLEHWNEIGEILRTRSVQTNEVGRCAILVPAFELVARQADLPLGLIEIGSSAGLTLTWDRYHYRYDKDLQCGPTDSAVQIECALRGGKRPPVPAGFPRIASRLGIDRNPIDLGDPESVRWLRALVWPEQLKRAELLKLAIQMAKSDPPKIVRGDALEAIPRLIDHIGRDTLPCIYHSFTLSLAGGKLREDLESLLIRASEKRHLFHISLEWTRNSETPLLTLARFRGGIKTERTLAKSQPHGEWLEWMNGS